MHPQQAAQRRRVTARRREDARLARGLRLARRGPAPALTVATVTLDLTEVTRSVQRMAEHFDRILRTMRYAQPQPQRWDGETEERLHRFHARHADSAFSDRPDNVTAARALCRQLGPQRWTKLSRYGWVVVQGGTTGDQYRVDVSPPGNVTRLSDGMRLCLAHPSHLAPVAALLACQIFLLERDEPRFLMSANHLGIGGGDRGALSLWAIQAVCFPDHFSRCPESGMPPPMHAIYAQVPVTPGMLRYDPVLNVRDGQTDEARAATPVENGIRGLVSGVQS